MDICPNCYGMKEWQGQDCPMCWGKGVIEQGVEAMPGPNWGMIGVALIILIELIVVGVIVL